MFSMKQPKTHQWRDCMSPKHVIYVFWNVLNKRKIAKVVLFFWLPENLFFLLILLIFRQCRPVTSNRPLKPPILADLIVELEFTKKLIKHVHFQKIRNKWNFFWFWLKPKQKYEYSSKMIYWQRKWHLYLFSNNPEKIS